MCPYDSNGNFTLDPGYLAVLGNTIQPSQHNPPLEDIQSGLSQVILRNGVAPMSGQLTLANADPTLPNHAVRKKYVDDGLSSGTTQPVKDNSTKFATTAFVQGEKGWLRAVTRLTAGAKLDSTSFGNLIVCDSATDMTLTLPSAPDTPLAFLDLINIGAGVVTLSGAFFHDGAIVSSVTLYQADSLRLVATAVSSGWFILNYDPHAISQADFVAGTSVLEGLISPAKLAAAIAAKFATYDSGLLDYTAGGLITLAHGLPSVPKHTVCTAVCAVANNGWAVGDEIFNALGGPTSGSTSTFWGVMVGSGATSIKVRISPDDLVMGDNLTGGRQGYSPINWKLRVRAFS